MVRSRMPGIVISGMCSRPSKTTCSQTSDRVVLLAEPRQQFEVFARIDHGRRIERIVEQHRLGLVVERALQHFFRHPPVRRFEA
jgi:hypothetical protein